MITGAAIMLVGVIVGFAFGLTKAGSTTDPK